jgi:NitT/TauT family transport system permease protein
VIGINAAVILLIVTSMLWNMIFGVYEAVKTIPNEFTELAGLYSMGLLSRLRRVFIPASLPRLSKQMQLSWAIGLFYLVTSEIFSIGNSQYAVQHGIGIALTKLGLAGNVPYYLLGLGMFVLAVIATKLLLFDSVEKYVTRYESVRYASTGQKQKIHLRFPHFGLRMRAKKLRQRENNNHRALERVKAGSWYVSYVVAAAVIFIAAFAVYSNWSAISQVSAYLPYYEELSFVSLAFSFLRVWGAFVLILVVAVPISIYVSFVMVHKEFALTLFQVLASIPATILLPFIASSFKGVYGSSEFIAIVVFFLSGLWYVIFSAISSVGNTYSSVREVKSVFGVRGLQLWDKVYFRSMVPGIITGAVTAIAAEWNASIVAEYFSSSVIGSGNVISSVSIGIGKLLDNALSVGNLLLMTVALINMVVMIILVNRFLWDRLYNFVSKIYR